MKGAGGWGRVCVVALTVWYYGLVAAGCWQLCVSADIGVHLSPVACENEALFWSGRWLEPQHRPGPAHSTQSQQRSDSWVRPLVFWSSSINHWIFVKRWLQFTPEHSRWWYYCCLFDARLTTKKKNMSYVSYVRWLADTVLKLELWQYSKLNIGIIVIYYVTVFGVADTIFFFFCIFFFLLFCTFVPKMTQNSCVCAPCPTGGSVVPVQHHSRQPAAGAGRHWRQPCPYDHSPAGQGAHLLFPQSLLNTADVPIN